MDKRPHTVCRVRRRKPKLSAMKKLLLCMVLTGLALTAAAGGKKVRYQGELAGGIALEPKSTTPDKWYEITIRHGVRLFDYLSSAPDSATSPGSAPLSTGSSPFSARLGVPSAQQKPRITLRLVRCGLCGRGRLLLPGRGFTPRKPEQDLRSVPNKERRGRGGSESG